MNEPTPALLILVVPLRRSAPSVRSRLNVPAPALLMVRVSALALFVCRVEEAPNCIVVSLSTVFPVPLASSVRLPFAPVDTVTAPAPVYELAAAIDTPVSDVIESALSASCTSTLPPALMVNVDCVDVIPPAPLTATVPENVPFTAVKLPVVTMLPPLSMVTKLLAPPATNALFVPVAVNEATVVAEDVAATGSLEAVWTIP